MSFNYSFKPKNGLDIGDTATDFSLKNVDGKRVSLADYKNVKGFIVVFTSNSCPYTIAYEDRMIDLSKKYKNDYPIIAINPNNTKLKPSESFEKMKDKAKSKNFDFAYLIDEEQTVFNAFGASRTPQVYLLDKNKEVKYIGAIDDNVEDATAVKNTYVENAIDDLEAGKDVKMAVTKAVGCGINSNKKV